MRSLVRSARVATVAVAAGAATVLLAGVGYAVWSTTGTGTGTAKAGTLQPATVGAGSAPAGQLYPGLVADGTTTGGDLVVVASNPNSYAVTVSVTGGTATGCTNAGVTVLAGTRFSLPAGASSVPTTLPKVLGMSGSAGNDCQGATLTVPLTTTTTTP